MNVIKLELFELMQANAEATNTAFAYTGESTDRLSLFKIVYRGSLSVEDINERASIAVEKCLELESLLN